MAAAEGYDFKRITHLLKIGFFAALLTLIADIILGYGNAAPGTTGLEANFSRYLSVSDNRIFWSALLGLIGIPTEGLCFFAVKRLIEPGSPKLAHAYRAGIIGVLILGGFVHVNCCASVYVYKKMNDLTAAAADETLKFALYFLIPATVIFFIFYLVLNITSIVSFAKGVTPLPRSCAVFFPLISIIMPVLLKLTGDHAITNAFATGWISFGGMWTFGGLFLMCKKHMKGS